MNNRLERYLAEISGHLGRLPVAWRTAELTEIRQHLEDAVVERQAYGLLEPTLTDEAIRQFGDAHMVAKRLRGAYWRGFFRRLDTPLTALPLALLVMMMTQLFYVLAAVGITAIYSQVMNGGTSLVSPPELQIALSTLVRPVWFLISGVILGYHFPRYGMLAAFCGELVGDEILVGIVSWACRLVVPHNGFHYLSAVQFAAQYPMLAACLGRWWARRAAFQRI